MSSDAVFEGKIGFRQFQKFPEHVSFGFSGISGMV